MRRPPVERFISRSRGAAYPPAVVLGSSVNSLSYLRSLGRRGIPVLCADTYRGIASRSRYGAFQLLEPQTGETISGAAGADDLFDTFHHHGMVPVAFGTADEWQVYLADRAASGKSIFRALVPEKATMDRIVDKQAQYEFAAELGIPVPPFANAADVLEGIVPWKVFPAIIKPRWSHTGRDAIGGKALLIETEAKLRQELARLGTATNVGEYLVQAVIDGRDDCLYAYLGCYDAGSREVSYLVKRKLRQHPPSFGDGSYDVTVADETLAAAARRILSALAYRGLVGIEFKKDPATGDFAMIEINPRTVSTNQLAITAGVDFPWHAYQLAVWGDTPKPLDIPASPGAYPLDLHHVHEERELRSFLRRWHNNETGLFEWLGCVLSAKSYAIWKLRDPWPFVWSVGNGSATPKGDDGKVYADAARESPFSRPTPAERERPPMNQP